MPKYNMYARQRANEHVGYLWMPPDDENYIMHAACTQGCKVYCGQPNSEFVVASKIVHTGIGMAY